MEDLCNGGTLWSQFKRLILVQLAWDFSLLGNIGY